MEVRHRILEFNNSPKYDQLQKELDKLGAVYKVENLGSIGDKEHRSIEFTISENDPLFPVISELIKKYDFYVQTGMYYSHQDIEVAEWVYATVGEYQYPQPTDNFGYLQATYDTSGYCAHCGTGAVQVHPFRLKRDFKQKNLHFLGLHWVHDEVFTRPEIKAAFEKEHISGVGFSHPVHYKSGENINSVYQMTVQTTAPPALVTDGLSIVTCMDNCGRVKYHFPQTDTIKLRRDSLASLPNIAKSHEYFGSGAAANRLVLMRSQVVKLVKEHKLRGLKFIPIEVV